MNDPSMLCWPVECGGNARSKLVPSRLDAHAGGRARCRINGRWNVMVIERGPDEFYLSGTMPAFSGEPPFGWVERIDPESLEPIAASGPLPCADHVWCGAIAAHANGSLYHVNGSVIQRLDAQLRVLAETRLPADRAHNGLLILGDGTLVTKDLRLSDQPPSVMTHLNPVTLDPIAVVELPEPSMGRIAADADDRVYVPGSEHIWRLVLGAGRLRLDERFAPRYRAPDQDSGMAWDVCLAGDTAWFMDNGDVHSVREIFHRHPSGRFDTPPGKRLSWQRPAPWSAPQGLYAVDTVTGSIRQCHPFDAPGGGIVAPPVWVPEVELAIAWDSVNGGLAGVNPALEVVWRADVRATMQPLVFTESNELVINDYRPGDDALVVIDVPSGNVKARISTGSKVANGMFLTPGRRRDVYYCSTLAVARVWFD